MLDLAGVPSVDSTGLGALLAGLRAARAAGGDLRLVHPSEQVRVVLELTTLDQLLRAYTSVEAALTEP